MSVAASLECQVLECARLFRLGRDVEAALQMVQVFDELVNVMGRCSPSVAEQYPVILNAMFLAQQRQDWLGLADTLEVELLQLLRHEGA